MNAVVLEDLMLEDLIYISIIETFPSKNWKDGLDMRTSCLKEFSGRSNKISLSAQVFGIGVLSFIYREDSIKKRSSSNLAISAS